MGLLRYRMPVSLGRGCGACCGVEGDGEDGGPAVEGVGDVEGAAEGFDALLGLGESELG